MRQAKGAERVEADGYTIETFGERGRHVRLWWAPNVGSQRGAWFAACGWG